MKRFFILFFAVFAAFTANSQIKLQDGDHCFDNGNYTCAETKYNEALKLANGKEKQVIEIKQTRVKWCKEHINTANTAFSSKNYKVAKENYQNVLDSNPKDVYAKTQLEKCNAILNPPIYSLKLSKESLSFPNSGGKESITVTTNASSYSVNNLPTWCSVQKYTGYFIITCEANSSSITRTYNFTVAAANKTLRINVSQSGTIITPEITLSVTKENLYFSALGGKSESIAVYSNASTYSISLVPSWCSVQTFNGYFIVSCNANNSILSLSDWFKVTAGGKEVKIYVTQSGTTNTIAEKPVVLTPTKKNSIQGKTKKCFNCPKTKDIWGITAGYIQKLPNNTEGIRLGLRVEPLFKYGFGLNTGLNVEGYSKNLSSTINGKVEFVQYTLNIPLHLEYRLNFSKWFNIFAYGGAGLNIVTNSLFDDYLIPTTFEYGGGLRINHVQFNIGRSLYLGDLKNTQNFGIYTESYQKLNLSVSYMF